MQIIHYWQEKRELGVIFNDKHADLSWFFIVYFLCVNDKHAE